MSWENIIKTKMQGPRQKMVMDEVPDMSYFEEKANVMQVALKGIHQNFNRLKNVYKKTPPHPKETTEFFMGLIEEALDEINDELIEMETYAEKLSVDMPRYGKRVSGTNLQNFRQYSKE